MSRRWIVVLVIVAAAIGGAAGSAITLLIHSDDDNDVVRGTLVHLGRTPDDLANFTPQPFCVPLHHFCITQPETGHPLALYTYDPHPIFREQGCEVSWDAGAEQTTQDGTVVHGLFADPCGGSRYDISGHRLFGPSPRDLDSFPVDVSGGGTVVDTRTLICGRQRGVEIPNCQRAPLGD